MRPHCLGICRDTGHKPHSAKCYLLKYWCLLRVWKTVIGFFSCLKIWYNSSTERGTKAAVCKISSTSLRHAWEAHVGYSANGSLEETGKKLASRGQIWF